MKKRQGFLIGLMCAITTSVSAQINTLSEDFRSNVPKPAQKETEIPVYTGIVDAHSEWLTSEERCRQILEETFYRIGECSELKIIDNQLRLVPLSDPTYVFRGTIIVPDKIRNGYFGTDSLLLDETEEHAILKAKLQAEGADYLEEIRSLKSREYYILKDSVEIVEEYERRLEVYNTAMKGLNPNKGLFKKEDARRMEELKSYCEELQSDCQMKLSAGAPNRTEIRNRIEQVHFMNRYYDHDEQLSALGHIGRHPYGRKFTVFQDSIGGIHYIQSSSIKEQFVAAKYYDRIRSEFVGQNICFLYGSSVTDAYSGECIPIEKSVLDADKSKSKKNTYLCKDIVVYGKQASLCAIIEKGDTRFLVSIERYPYPCGFSEEKLIDYKHVIKLHDASIIPESVFDAEEQKLMQKKQKQMQDKQAEIQARENAQKAEAAQQKAQEEARKAELIRRFGTEYGLKIAQGRVALGMSKEMCLEAWGTPTRRQLSKTLTGTNDVWYYSWKNRRLVFANNKLVEIFE